MLHLFSRSLFGYSWKSRLVVLAVNVVGLAIFLSAGYLLDQYLATAPAMLILGLLLSFPVVQFVTARVLLSRYHSGKTTPSDS